MRKQQLQIDSGGEVACSSEGFVIVSGTDAIQSSESVAKTAGANKTETGDCGVSLTFCSPFSQCF